MNRDLDVFEPHLRRFWTAFEMCYSRFTVSPLRRYNTIRIVHSVHKKRTWNKRNMEDKTNNRQTLNKTVNRRTTTSSYCIMVHCHFLLSQRNKCTSQESPKRNCKELACAQRYTLLKIIRHQSKTSSYMPIAKKKMSTNKSCFWLSSCTLL